MSNPKEMLAKFDVAQGYAGQWREQTDTADAFRDGRGFGKSTFDVIGVLPAHKNPACLGGYRYTKIAPELYGKPWNNEALGILLGFVPSAIRMVTPKTGMTLEAGTGKITVFLEADDRTIKSIDMSTEIVLGLLTLEQMNELKLEETVA